MTTATPVVAELIVHQGRTHMSPVLEIPEGFCSSHGLYQGLECSDCLQTEETETENRSPISEPDAVVWIVRVNSRTARKPDGPKAAA
jgi:hypothetical protein